jgi:hypothetical protein
MKARTALKEPPLTPVTALGLALGNQGARTHMVITMVDILYIVVKVVVGIVQVLTKAPIDCV